MKELKEVDQQLYQYIAAERERQSKNIELIASENFTSRAVMEAAASCLTNKYAEGYPANRYYGGCEYVDQAEELAIQRAKKIFGAEHANVQAHSGSQANMAAYMALLSPGDKILGMDLAQGGHLTHGSQVNFSGQLYDFIHYGVNQESERIDFKEVRQLAQKHQPRMIVAGASAYSREIDFAKFKEIAVEVGAYLLVDMAHIAGLVAADLHPNPVEWADIVTSTTHKTLRGTRGGLILCKGDYAKVVDKAIFPGIQGGPLMHIIAAKAVAFKEAMSQEFKEYQKQTINNAAKLAEVLQSYGMRLVSGGTDNHLILVDLAGLGITGQEAEQVLDQIGVTVNKNTIPNETQGPAVTSGIRIGTPAVTTKGMKEVEMEKIGEFIYQALINKEQDSKLKELQQRCYKLSAQFNL